MKFKKVLSVFLAVVFIFSAFSTVNAFAYEDRNVIASGICGAEGDNLKWSLYEDGELVISGKGEMSFYYISEKAVEISSPFIPPWYDYFDDIRVITVEEGVTGIGDAAFGLYPRMYHRVNLPKSLKYYYSGSFVAAHPDDITLACCYAGTESEWNKVEQRSWTTLRPDLVTGEIITIAHRNPKYGWGISDNATDDMYYNSEEPEAYCEIVHHGMYSSSQLQKGETAEFHIKYYPGEHSGAKLVWRTEGDSCTMQHTKYSPSGVPTYAEITSVTHGDYSVIAELVAPDGTVICSDREEFFSYVREDMNFKEKAEEFFNDIALFFKGILGYGFLLVYYGFTFVAVSIVGTFNSIFN